MSRARTILISRSRQLIALSAMIVLLASPVLPQRPRMVLGGKGKFADIPVPRPLRYFTANLFQREYCGDLCVECAPGGITHPCNMLQAVWCSFQS